MPGAELVTASPGEHAIRRVTVAGTDILLGRLSGDRLVAFAATCPHQQTDLQDATVFDGRIRCPLHNYLYDPETGENVVPARDADPANLWKLRPGYLPVHPVEERDGWIWVGPQPLPPPASYDPAKERPPPPGSRRRGPPEPLAAPTPRTPVEHDSVALQVVVGTTFELRLTTPPRPGFFWRVETSGPLLAVVEERFEPVEPPSHLVRVAARETGETTLRCAYARPWDAEPVEVRTYRVSIQPSFAGPHS